MTRYWVSWWSGYYASEGCTEPPFQIWTSGEHDRPDGKSELSLCAVIDADSEAEIWAGVRKHFPDFVERFCTPQDAGFQPGDRFPGFEGRTRLSAQVEE